MSSQAVLDELWDPDDAAASEQRLRARIGTTRDRRESEELATQLARAQALQGRFDEGRRTLDALEPTEDVALARVDLERGRILKLERTPLLSVRHFRLALELAERAGDDFLVVDAIHLLALVDTDDVEGWTARGLSVLERVDDPRTLRWGFALRRILGQYLAEAGRWDEAFRELHAAEHAAGLYGVPAQQRLIAVLIDDYTAARESADSRGASGPQPVG